mmetsp:Transcript_11204/g.23548  ORF Transcript_11204/g.23548 Transcript_11204/m.23548 type:complete len:226 (+) Transcript_11204:500-1177(+)
MRWTKACTLWKHVVRSHHSATTTGATPTCIRPSPQGEVGPVSAAKWKGTLVAAALIWLLSITAFVFGAWFSSLTCHNVNKAFSTSGVGRATFTMSSKAPPYFSRMTRFVPMVRMTPLTMIQERVQRASHSSMECVDKSTELLFCWDATRLITLHMKRLATGSMPALGSSARIVGGSPMRAMATMSFRLLPPERFAAKFWAWALRPNWSIFASTTETILSGATPLR